MWVKSITGKTIGDIRGWRVVIEYNKARGGYTVWVRGANPNFQAYKTEDQATRAAELWAMRRPPDDLAWKSLLPMAQV